MKSKLSAIVLAAIILVLALLGYATGWSREVVAPWSLVASSGATSVGLLWASSRLDGAFRTIMLILGLGYAAHSTGDIGYAVLVMPEDAPGFADAWWWFAYPMFFAAGILGLYYLSQLTFTRYTIDWIAAIIAGAAAIAVGHFIFGQSTYADALAAGVGRTQTYWLDISLPGTSMAAAVLFAFLAVRSRGGIYSTLFTFPAVGLAGAAIADVLYGITRDSYQFGDPTDWFRVVGQMVILAMVPIVLNQRPARAQEA